MNNPHIAIIGDGKMGRTIAQMAQERGWTVCAMLDSAHNRDGAGITRRALGDPDVAIFAGPVTTSGRIEMLPFLHEQAISITAHRFGNPDPSTFVAL